jgi:acid phosphatase family membrane protein YuiD
MSVVLHPDNSLIEHIGAELIRTTYRLSPQRLYAWRRRGIPSSHRAAVAQLATLHGKSVPSDFLSPPEARAAA